MQQIFILGDQLNRWVGPLASADPAQTIVLLIESVDHGRRYPFHKQKLALLYSAMRHFRDELIEAGFQVRYRQVDRFETGLAEHFAEFPGAHLTLMEPADWGIAERLQSAASSLGGNITLVPNAFWLSTKADWDAYANGKKQLRMEYFYREMRRKTGWLVVDGQPVGGKWNYDSENRATPEPDHQFPPRQLFPPDELTQTTIDWVEVTFPNHYGSTVGFNWPVTRAQARELLEHFLETRLTLFGPYEDAMVQREHVLYHSLLSAALNLGLLTAREVCETALTYEPQVPLASLEGFIRQILGWREFMYHIYRSKMPDFRNENRLNHHVPLPDFYWTGTTNMNCVAQSVQQLLETGHTHHIQRLMVLGNFALLAGVSPQELNDWFLTMYVDAYDWVVSPNVLGMSQYADLGSFTSKPYISGAAYINRMSDYCDSCVYNPNQTVGETACPFASLYWDFLERHAPLLKQNQRMSMIVHGWLKRKSADRQVILEQAIMVKQRLARGEV
jgi:deoxyribodipyrimidine photolyase-related protein